MLCCPQVEFLNIWVGHLEKKTFSFLNYFFKKAPKRQVALPWEMHPNVNTWVCTFVCIFHFSQRR